MWLEDDTLAALEWQAWEANKCPGCGRQRDECMADDGPDYRTRKVVCYACEDRDITARAAVDASNGRSEPGVYFVTEEDDHGS